MVEKREIIGCSVFGARAVYISRLWTPETTDFTTGKPLDKPRYSVTAIVPKTTGRWQEDPVFASVTEACRKIYAQHFAGYDVARLIWPVKDGDQPSLQGKVSEWSKGHWCVRADTSSPDYLSIEGVQNGKAVAIPAARMGGRVVVKDGDYCVLSIGLAKSNGTSPGIKTYLNGILFTGSGEEIKLGSRVDSNTLIEQAKAKGIPVQGIGAAPAAGGFQGLGAGAPGDDIPF